MDKWTIFRKAYQLLFENPADYKETGTNEIVLTKLAEATAHELNHDEWLDDPDHVVWDVVIEAVDTWRDNMRSFDEDFAWRR